MAEYTNTKPLQYITKDASLIRELLNPQIFPQLNLSLAEATVAAGDTTLEHLHIDFDEIYYFLEGNGTLYINGQPFTFQPGYFFYLPKMSRHYLQAKTPTRILCICNPPYNHRQTKLFPVPGQA